jgi:signal transduction histidine kinase
MSFSFSGALEGVGESWGFSEADQYLSGAGSAVPPDAQKILDTLGAHIAVLDRSGRIIAVNRAWSQFALDNDGLPEQTGVGTNYLHVCERAKGHDTEDAGKSFAGLQAVLDGSQPEFRLEYPCHSPTERRWFLLHASPLRCPSGGVVTTHLTITERKLAEEAVRQSAVELTSSNEELRRLAAELEEMARSRQRAYQEVAVAYQELKEAQSRLVQAEKLSSLGQLVAGVAHEINNPLAFVTNNVSLLRREFQGLGDLVKLYQTADETLAEHRPDLLAHLEEMRERIDLGFVLESLDGLMDRTGHGLKRIHRIVASLRNFARLDEADLKEVDLNEGIRSTVNIIRGKAKECGVELHLELSPLPPLPCYPGQINQVVLNLLTNAIDACPGGGKVAVRTRALADGVQIQVIDDGQGIDPEIQDRIFDPFFTTKPVGQGTGLGLSISYGIVESHGGRLEVESTPGEGSHFTVWLPRSFPLAGK